MRNPMDSVEGESRLFSDADEDTFGMRKRGPDDYDHEEDSRVALELQQRCIELEQRLQKDPLSFENEALEVQLTQMKDDYTSLQEDFKSMTEYFGRRIADLSSQLEERARAAGTAKGHADCLTGLLGFHEDNGELACSYWKAQCEKRNDSIRFLSLKLQEYTVPSSEYQTRRRSQKGSNEVGDQETGNQSKMPKPSDVTTRAASSPVYSSPPSSPTTLRSSPKSSISNARSEQAMRALQRQLEALDHSHGQLCELVEKREARVQASTKELQMLELSCAVLQPRNTTFSTVEVTETLQSLEAEVAKLQQEVCKSEQAINSADRKLPSLTRRCLWRDELDVRAGQLERISLQFDATKRSLDAANEELQWQATSAEALRMRLADVLRASALEGRRSEEVAAEERRREESMEDILSRWVNFRGSESAHFPTAYNQAHQLLTALRASQDASNSSTSK